MSFPSFLRPFALCGLLSACTFANYHPPLSQAVAPGYKVVRVLPPNPKPYDFVAVYVQPEDMVVAESDLQPEPAVAPVTPVVPVAAVTPEPEVGPAQPEPEVVMIAPEPEVVIIAPEAEVEVAVSPTVAVNPPAVDAAPKVVSPPEVIFHDPSAPEVSAEDLVEPTPAVVPEPQADNRYALAEQALDRGAYADAFPYFLSLIEDHPSNPDFFFRAGFAAFMAGANGQGESWFPQATALLRRCLELHPQHIEGQFVLGCVYDWSEEWFAAENAYQRAIELDPGHRKSIQNLAALYQRQGLESKARELLIRLRRL